MPFIELFQCFIPTANHNPETHSVFVFCCRYYYRVLSTYDMQCWSVCTSWMESRDLKSRYQRRLWNLEQVFRYWSDRNIEPAKIAAKIDWDWNDSTSKPTIDEPIQLIKTTFGHDYERFLNHQCLCIKIYNTHIHVVGDRFWPWSVYIAELEIPVLQ